MNRRTPEYLAMLGSVMGGVCASRLGGPTEIADDAVAITDEIMRRIAESAECCTCGIGPYSIAPAIAHSKTCPSYEGAP